jgi:arylsulfatase B
LKEYVLFNVENHGSNFPLRGTKATLWEGGVRVPGFAWSPLFENSGRVSNSLIHVTDITPTFLEAADSVYYEKTKDELDGISIWKLLRKDGEPEREEILLNIDPIYNMSAIIADKKWKLVQGRVPTNKSLKSSAFSPSYASKNETENETLKRLKKLRFYRMNSIVRRVLEKMDRYPNYDNIEEEPIDCGDQNQGNVCDATKSLCLFDIESDPCEYNNLAQEYPKIVKELWNKILKYNDTAVPPLSLTPIDPYFDPYYHNGIWDIYVH